MVPHILDKLRREREAALKKLVDAKAFVQGSLYEKKVVCGKPNCRCARGEPHKALVLTRKVDGKTVTTHVPSDLHDEVRAWVKENQRIKELTRRISDLSVELISRHVRENRAAAQSQKPPNRTPSKSNGM